MTNNQADGAASAGLSRRNLIGGGASLAGAAMAFLPDKRAAAAPAVGPADIVVPGTRLEMTIRFAKDGDDRVRGRERVTYAFNLDGTITMSARSESYDPPVVRDVIYLLGPDFGPLSCHVQITDAGKYVGSGWFRMTDRAVEIEGFSASAGRISRRISVDSPVRALVAHPVSTDVHVGMAADKSRPGVPVEVKTVYLTSADPYGRTGPDLVAADIAVAYLSTGAVDTPVGRLPSDHYLLYLRGPGGGFDAFQDLWCIAGTPVFLKAFARAPFSTRYEISELHIEGARTRFDPGREG